MHAKHFRYLAAFFSGERKRLLAGSLLAMVLPLGNIGVLLLFREIFEKYFPAHDMRRAAIAGLSAMVLYLAIVAIQLWSRRTILRAVQNGGARLRVSILSDVIARGKRAERGALHGLLTYDVVRVEGLASAVFVQYLPALAVALCLTGAYFVMIGPLFVGLVAVVILVGLFACRSAVHIRRAIQDHHRNTLSFQSKLLFVIGQIVLIKTRGAEKSEMAEVENVVAAQARSGFRYNWLRNVSQVKSGTLLMFGSTILLLAGGAAVTKGWIDMGHLFSLYLGFVMLRAQLTALTNGATSLQEGLVALERIYEPRQPSPGGIVKGGVTKITVHGDIVVRGVTFSFKEHDTRPLLDSVSFCVRPGGITLLSGPNGCGKTTLIDLMLGLSAFQEGEILIEGIPVQALDLSHYRSQIGVVRQQAELFSGSVRENISYGFPGATAERVEAAARWAVADGFINEMPEKYDTMIGDGGEFISGGQRQCLALARALIHQPALLILDEPENHLSQDVARTVIDSILALPWRPALLIVSHNPGMILKSVKPETRVERVDLGLKRGVD